MKAMMLTGIRQMEMREIPTPTIVKANDVLIKMKRVGVCGSDVHYYTAGKIGDQVVNYPFPVGHEGAGKVEKIGSAVRRVKPGDRIAIEPAMPCFECDQCLEGRYHTCRELNFLGCPGQADGCLSEYIIMPESSCIPISEKLSYDQAAISEPLAIGVYAAKQAGNLKGKNIAILGFGPIGMSVFLAARQQGANHIFVTDKIKERNDIALKLGAIYAQNPDEEDVVSAITVREPKMLDVVFECCGKQEAIDNAVDLLRSGGKLMIVGIPEFERWSFSVDKIRRKELSINNIRRQVDCVEPSLEMMMDGRIDVSLMPTHRFNFENTKAAFDLVCNYKDGVMKAMIDFD